MDISNNKKLQNAESCFLFEAIIVAVKLLTEIDHAALIRYNIVLAFTAIGLSDIMRAFRYRKSSKFESRKFAGIGILLLLGAVITACLPPMQAVCASFYIFSASLLYSRIIKIIFKHKVANTLWNILLMFISFYLIIVPLYGDTEIILSNAIILGLTMTIQVLLRMIEISMSKIRFDILKRIFVKSMASEVFYGLMILIVTFSVVFQAFEPDINTFGDGMWYCFALVTTIGFGDMTAVTVIGRVLSVILGIYGIIVVALITSIIINFYNETKDFVMNDESGPEEELPEKDAGSQPPAEK